MGDGERVRAPKKLSLSSGLNSGRPARQLWKGSRHGGRLFEIGLYAAHARVHGNGTLASFKGIFQLSLEADIVVGAIWRVGELGWGFLGHGAKVVGSALDDQRAFESKRRQAADSVAVLVAILKLLGKDATLESKGVERRELGGRLASNVQARGAKRSRCAGEARSMRICSQFQQIRAFAGHGQTGPLAKAIPYLELMRAGSGTWATWRRDLGTVLRERIGGSVKKKSSTKSKGSPCSGRDKADAVVENRWIWSRNGCRSDGRYQQTGKRSATGRGELENKGATSEAMDFFSG